MTLEEKYWGIQHRNVEATFHCVTILYLLNKVI